MNKQTPSSSLASSENTARGAFESQSLGCNFFGCVFFHLPRNIDCASSFMSGCELRQMNSCVWFRIRATILEIMACREHLEGPDTNQLPRSRERISGTELAGGIRSCDGCPQVNYAPVVFSSGESSPPTLLY